MTNKRLHPINNILYSFSLNTVKIIMLLFTGILLVSGLLLTSYATDMETQLVLYGWDNPLFTLPGTVIFCLLLFAAAFMALRNTTKSGHWLLRLFVLVWCLIMGIILILFSKSVPASDGYSVYDIAARLAVGDTSVVHPTDSYLSYYPQQVGLAAFWEILIRIWNMTHINQHAYHFLKLVYLLLECIIIVFQEKIIHILWEDEKAECLYLLLAGASCPLIMYTSYLYGEIPSFAAISISFYLLLRLLADELPSVGRTSGIPLGTCATSPAASTALQKASPTPHTANTISWKAFGVSGRHTAHSIFLALGSLLFLTLSVMLRKNSLIFMIAAVLVLLLCGLKQKRPLLFLLAALCIACSLTILPGIQKMYEHRSGSYLSSGVPAMSYFAMGMQESSRADGWYNGFNFYTFQDTGMDRSATIAISRDAIRERLAYFRENPGYAARFYLHKYLSQWADGTYACRQSTRTTFGGRSPFFVSLYEGEYSKYLIGYCNIYQNVLYLGAFWFCLMGLLGSSPVKSARGFQLPAYLGLICALGGFLFHMIWEGNSRYILLYGLAMLPYTARGLSLIQTSLCNRLRCRKASRGNTGGRRKTQ